MPAFSPMRRRQDYSAHRGACRGVTRVGIGYDSHRFVEGRPLVLGGLRHSARAGPRRATRDADAVAHALTDAILGARRRRRHRPAVSRYRPPVEGRRFDGAAADGARARPRPRAHAGRRRTAHGHHGAAPPGPPRRAMAVALAGARSGSATGAVERQGQDQRGNGIHRSRRGIWPSWPWRSWRPADRVPARVGVPASTRRRLSRSSACSPQSRTCFRRCPPTPRVALGAFLSHRGVTLPIAVFLVTWSVQPARGGRASTSPPAATAGASSPRPPAAGSSRRARWP